MVHRRAINLSDVRYDFGPAGNGVWPAAAHRPNRRTRVLQLEYIYRSNADSTRPRRPEADRDVRRPTRYVLGRERSIARAGRHPTIEFRLGAIPAKSTGFRPLGAESQ